MEQITSLRKKLFQWPDDFSGNEISELGNKDKSKHQMVKDKPYKYGAASSMGTQEEYFKNIKKPNKNSKNCVGRMGHQVCPPHQRTKIF